MIFKINLEDGILLVYPFRYNYVKKSCMIKQQFLVGLLLLSFISLTAQQRKYVNEFLQIGVGGRGLGMAGAQVASVNDVTSPFWNPAGLSYIRNDLQIGLMHSEYFNGIAKYDYIGVSTPTRKKKGVLGLSLIRFGIDNIPYTLNLIEPDGSVNYARVKAISAADYAGLVTYAQQLKIKKYANRPDVDFRVGGNFKIIHRSIGTMGSAWGAGIDAGIQGRFKRWCVGATIKDITTTYTIWSFSYTEAEKQKLLQSGNEIVSRSTEVNTPRAILGMGRYLPIRFKDTTKSAYLLVEANTDVTTDGSRYGNLINLNPVSIDPRLGLEFGYNKLFYVRAGVGNFQRVLNDDDTTNTSFRTMFQPSFGLGLKIKSLHIDYAFSSLNVQNNPLYSHFISLKLGINKKTSYYDETNLDIDDSKKNKNKGPRRKNY
jgi:hypothetical protein